jgi:hypothetical protein
LNSINAKNGFRQQEYDADYLEEVRAKERRMEKERRREEREAERERRRAERHAEREERQRKEELQRERDEQAERERLREEERERRREEKRQLRRAEKERQRQLELAQEQAEAESREMQRNAEREKLRQLRKQEERQRRRGETTTREYEDDYDNASSPAVRTPHKTKWRLWDDYEELQNEDSPRTKYFEKAHSPKRKSRVISGPYLEDQRSEEVYEYRKEKLEGSSDGSGYTSTTVWKKKRNKRICETMVHPVENLFTNAMQVYMFLSSSFSSPSSYPSRWFCRRRNRATPIRVQARRKVRRLPIAIWMVWTPTVYRQIRREHTTIHGHGMTQMTSTSPTPTRQSAVYPSLA